MLIYFLVFVVSTLSAIAVDDLGVDQQDGSSH